jgi:cell division protein FtsL
MVKLNILLALILITSALGVVTSQHKARSLFAALESERETARQLDVKWGQLQLEQSTLAMHGRIEQIARTKLNMKAPSESRVQIVTAAHPVDAGENSAGERMP